MRKGAGKKQARMNAGRGEANCVFFICAKGDVQKAARRKRADGVTLQKIDTTHLSPAQIARRIVQLAASDIETKDT